MHFRKMPIGFAMSPSGGKRWIRGLALLLVFISTGAAMGSCAYEDAELSPTTAAPMYSRPAPAPRRRPTPIWPRFRRETKRNWILAWAHGLTVLSWAAQADWAATGSDLCRRNTGGTLHGDRCMPRRNESIP